MKHPVSLSLRNFRRNWFRFRLGCWPWRRCGGWRACRGCWGYRFVPSPPAKQRVPQFLPGSPRPLALWTWLSGTQWSSKRRRALSSRWEPSEGRAKRAGEQKGQLSTGFLPFLFEKEMPFLFGKRPHFLRTAFSDMVSSGQVGLQFVGFSARYFGQRSCQHVSEM